MAKSPDRLEMDCVGVTRNTPLPVVESQLFIPATGCLLGSGVRAQPQWPEAWSSPKIRGAEFKTLSVGWWSKKRGSFLRFSSLPATNFIALPGTSFGDSTPRSPRLLCW